MTEYTRHQQLEDAVATVGNRLTALAKAGREPDLWEREALAEAISAIFRGAYALASANADLMNVGASQRTQARVPDPAFERFDLATLTNAFVVARDQPFLSYPVLGPILVGRG